MEPNDEIKDDIFQFDYNPQSTKDKKKNIIYLYRECEMYQWKETRSRIANKYSKTWNSNYIDSGTFENIESHQNPQSNMIPSKLFYTKNFKVSNFEFNLENNESITILKFPFLHC